MPWTPAQRRLLAVKYRRGEISKAQFEKMMAEGIRRDVDRTGHAKRRRKRSAKRRSRR